MPIIRAQDPNANSKSHQIKQLLGKMCDMELSTTTKRECTDKLTELMRGLPMTAQTFIQLGLEAKMNVVNNQKILLVHVPAEYVSSGIADNRNNQWISFGLSSVLDTENLGKNDVVEIENLKK